MGWIEEICGRVKRIWRVSGNVDCMHVRSGCINACCSDSEIRFICKFHVAFHSATTRLVRYLRTV